MSVDNEGTMTCSKCGAELDPDSNFCQKCGASRTGEPAAGAGGRKVEPWALKASQGVKKLSLKVKIGVPVAILVIIAIVVLLLVAGAMHSPEAALSGYLTKLKNGDYQQAYQQVVKGGVLTQSFFLKWQDTLSNNVGRLRDFDVVPRSKKAKFFGRVLAEDQSSSGQHQFVVTYKYVDKSFDANVTVEDAGGTWPFKSYRIRLADESTRVFASPLGARVIVDGQFVGNAKQSKALEDALSLNVFPKNVSDAIDYVKRLSGAISGLVDDVKRILRDVDTITGNVQTSLNKVGKGGVPWSDVVNSFKQTVESSKDLGASVARTAIHIYWMFGGGNDGTLRSTLERTQPMVELQNLPSGYHLAAVALDGTQSQTKEFYAPDDVVVDLKPDGNTEADLKTTMDVYYGARSNADFTANGAGLSAVMAGKELEQENAKVAELSAKGQHVASQMTSLEYKKFQMLSKNVATVETNETWNFITYQGPAVVSTDMGANRKVIYTLELRDGTWKVIEHKNQ